MSKILLQTTIPANPDDWDISRFSLLADELRAAGHEVIARNRDNRGDDDPVLSHVDKLDYDQLWLMAVDVGDGLSAADADAIVRFRQNGGGVLTARDHQDLGCCLYGLGSLGVVNEFHDTNIDPASMCDDQDTPDHLVAQLPLRCQRRLSAGPDRGAGPRVAAHRSDRQRSDRMVPVAPARGFGVGERPVRHRARAGPQHSVRPPLQPRRCAGRRARAGRPADGPSDRRIDVPPLRRLQLGSRSRGALVCHRAARHARSRPTRRGLRSSRTTFATSRRGCNP